MMMEVTEVFLISPGTPALPRESKSCSQLLWSERQRTSVVLVLASTLRHRTHSDQPLLQCAALHCNCACRYMHTDPLSCYDGNV